MTVTLQGLVCMNRQVKHQTARTAVASRLRRMGISVEEAPRNGKFDLLLNGELRVALRVAFPGRYAHTVKVNGRRYAYDYQSWNFNFHRHGRWERKYCDVFVCVAKHRRTADETFIIPAERDHRSDVQLARRRQGLPRSLRRVSQPLEYLRDAARRHRVALASRVSSVMGVALVTARPRT